MNKIEKLLEKFSSVLNEEQSVDFKEAIDTAINEVATTKANELFESEKEVYENSLNEIVDGIKKSITLDLQEQFDAKVDEEVQTKVEAKEVELQESVNAKLDEEVQTLKEDTKKYVAYGVKKLVEEALPTWEKEADLAKANKIMEEFNLFAQAFDTKLSEVTNNDDKIMEVNKELDEAIDKVKQLEDEKKLMVQESILKEAKANLTAPQQDKLTTLMEGVVCDTVEAYQKKLDLYKSTLVEVKTKDVINENKNDKSYTPSWKRD